MREYGRKGLTIVGVSNEPAELLEPFIDDQGIQYIVAVGGGAGYRYRFVPHAWLVSSTGRIVWEGNPRKLPGEVLARELKSVRFTPVIKLPAELKKARRFFQKGDFGKGIKSLTEYLEEPESKKVAKRAKRAIKKAQRFGSDKLKSAMKDAKDGYYEEAIESLTALKKMFKGHNTGDRAATTLKKWTKDQTVKTELAGLRALSAAEEAIRNKNYKKANALLQRVLRSKKFKDTKVRERVEKAHQRIQRLL